MASQLAVVLEVAPKKAFASAFEWPGWSRSGKTPEAASAVANLVVLPMAFLSGTFFPLEFAPGWVKTVSSFLPLRHLVDGLLDVMVRGQGPAAALPEIGILLAFAVVVGGIAIALFRWDD